MATADEAHSGLQRLLDSLQQLSRRLEGALILVVQVQDGSEKKPSKTDLDEVVHALEDELGGLPARAIAHSFQEGSAIEMNGKEVRYLAPANIDGDPEVQVVVFKTSLNTGWDCPRAEVIMSFRTAVDPVSIAQVVGRMVRTPLARRIDSSDFLNGSRSTCRTMTKLA